jgi:hypothetical protein
MKSRLGPTQECWRIMPPAADLADKTEKCPMKPQVTDVDMAHRDH